MPGKGAPDPEKCLYKPLRAPQEHILARWSIHTKKGLKIGNSAKKHHFEGLLLVETPFCDGEQLEPTTDDFGT